MTAKTAMPDRLRRLLPLLLIASMMGPLTLNILMASLPGLVVTFGTTREMVQLTLSLFLIGMAASQLIVGPLADRYGRRPMMIACAMTFAAASLYALTAKTIETIIIARVFQALGATAGLTLSRTIIGDLSNRENTARLIAYVTMVMVVAPMTAPGIGNALESTFGWRAIFLFCAALGGGIGLAAMLKLGETRPDGLDKTTAREVARRSVGLFSNPVFVKYAVTSATASAAFFTFLGAAPHLVIEAMGRSPAEYSRWFMLMALGYGLGNFTSARLAARLGIERIAGLGNLVGFIGVLIMLALAVWGVQHPAALFLPAVLFTYGNGLVIPNAAAGAIQANREAAGAASGLMGAGQMALGAFTSYLVGKILGDTAFPMIAIMLVTSLIAIVVTPPLIRAR